MARPRATTPRPVQGDLFATLVAAAPAAPPPRPPRDLAALTWVTGPTVARNGLASYVHLIRSPDDPERGDIRLLPEHLRDRHANWRRGLAKRPLVEFRAPIRDLLAAGGPRTFNAIGVLLLDKTADVLLNLPPDCALWTLVAEGLVEHSMEAPILFRLTEAGRAAGPEQLATEPTPEALGFALADIASDPEEEGEEEEGSGDPALEGMLGKP